MSDISDASINKAGYMSSQYPIKAMTTANGNAHLTGTKVMDLITAMASVKKPAIGQATLSPAHGTQLAGIFASPRSSTGGRGLIASTGLQASVGGVATTSSNALHEPAAAGVMRGGCYPAPRQDRMGEWRVEMGGRANDSRLQAWLVGHGYDSIEAWLESDTRPRPALGSWPDQFTGSPYLDSRAIASIDGNVPTVETPMAAGRPWVTGEPLAGPGLEDDWDGQAPLPMREWLSALPRNLQTASDDLYQSLAEVYAQERSSQPNPVVDSIQIDERQRADVASNYQRLIGAMSIAGLRDASLAASGDAHNNRMSIEASFI